ncbi:hypothetical protein BDZ88DRAFT_262097 [Geranomyces variabilis]|nr:hypothetical protein BDZ88DRAFT_262097 [Geranomyces variabilis]KAJ3131965.1 hypothetical protein HDU90_007627 [Geranomyces variabilis]
MTFARHTFNPSQLEKLAKELNKKLGKTEAEYSSESLAEYFESGDLSNFQVRTLRPTVNFINDTFNTTFKPSNKHIDELLAMVRDAVCGRRLPDDIYGNLPGDALDVEKPQLNVTAANVTAVISDCAEATQRTGDTAGGAPQMPTPAVIAAATHGDSSPIHPAVQVSHLMGSYPPYQPHISITINGFDKPQSTETSSPAVPKPSLKDKAVKIASTVASAVRSDTEKKSSIDGDTTGLNPSGVDSEPTSGAYYVIAIGGLAGLIVGFIIACVQIDLQALISAPVGATLISAEGALLKAYFNKRQRERIARKNRIRRDLETLCDDEYVKTFLDLVALCRIPFIGKECRNCKTGPCKDGEKCEKECRNCKTGPCKDGEKCEKKCKNCETGPCEDGEKCELIIGREACLRLPLEGLERLSMKQVREKYLYFSVDTTPIKGSKVVLREACRAAIKSFHLKWVHYRKQDRVLLEEVLRETSDKIDIVHHLLHLKNSVFYEVHDNDGWRPKAAGHGKEHRHRTRIYHLCAEVSYFRQLQSFFEFVDFLDKIHQRKRSRVDKLRKLCGLPIKTQEDEEAQMRNAYLAEQTEKSEAALAEKRREADESKAKEPAAAEAPPSSTTANDSTLAKTEHAQGALAGPPSSATALDPANAEPKHAPEQMSEATKSAPAQSLSLTTVLDVHVADTDHIVDQTSSIMKTTPAISLSSTTLTETDPATDQVSKTINDFPTKSPLSTATTYFASAKTDCDTATQPCPSSAEFCRTHSRNPQAL